MLKGVGQRQAKRQPLSALDARQRYSIPECAGYLRLSRAQVWRKIAAGELPTVRDGRRTFINGQVIFDASA